MKKCFHCKKEAVWTMQFLGGEAEYGFYEPTFTLLGSHYRGFKTWHVCDKCKEDFKKFRLFFQNQQVVESPF